MSFTIHKYWWSFPEQKKHEIWVLSVYSHSPWSNPRQLSITSMMWSKSFIPLQFPLQGITLSFIHIYSNTVQPVISHSTYIYNKTENLWLKLTPISPDAFSISATNPDTPSALLDLSLCIALPTISTSKTKYWICSLQTLHISVKVMSSRNCNVLSKLAWYHHCLS